MAICAEVLLGFYALDLKLVILGRCFCVRPPFGVAVPVWQLHSSTIGPVMAHRQQVVFGANGLGLSRVIPPSPTSAP